jgi:ppGpp synthetase/RelA/SpoT-type nucleotidyltranferase
MQDIAGARLLVVPRIDRQEVIAAGLADALADRLVTIKDTRAAPDRLGYRAIHIVVLWDSRLAEIQLRTALQQLWAQRVEQLDREFGTDLKHGVGPA